MLSPVRPVLTGTGGIAAAHWSETTKSLQSMAADVLLPLPVSVSLPSFTCGSWSSTNKKIGTIARTFTISFND